MNGTSARAPRVISFLTLVRIHTRVTPWTSIYRVYRGSRSVRGRGGRFVADERSTRSLETIITLLCKTVDLLEMLYEAQFWFCVRTRRNIRNGEWR